MIYLRHSSDDPPVLPCNAWSSHSHSGLLGTAFSVHIGATFLSIRSSRKYDISHWCTNITMVTWDVQQRTLKLREKQFSTLTPILQVSTGRMNVFTQDISSFDILKMIMESHTLVQYLIGVQLGLDTMYVTMSIQHMLHSSAQFIKLFSATVIQSFRHLYSFYSGFYFIDHHTKIIFRNCTASIICYA